ncbi:MAG: PIG-L deacetylase family protein [Anaerolineales bacterium]
MLGFFVLILMSLAVFSGGLLSLFAGRRWYTVWLGFATYFFITRILDLALFRTPEVVRNWGGLLIAALLVALIVIFRERVIHFVPPIGGFIVGALITERLLGYIDPEAGKFLFFAVLILGGLLGFYIFSRRLDFDDAVILLSALWGAAYVSKVIFDIVDIFLISAVSVLGSSFAGFLDTTMLLQTLLWLGLALLGIFVQRRLGFKPIPVTAQKAPATPESEGQPAQHRRWLAIAGISILLVVFLLVTVIGSNNQLSRSIRTSLNNLEHSLGLEAEAPGDAPWEWTTTLLRPQLELQDDDRLLVVVPHPDDDILSTAGVIQQALDKVLPVKVVFFTNGDYNETSFALYRKEITLDQTEALRLGETRREEALAAQGILGVTPEQIIFLGYPDGGGLEIFEQHWGDSEPYQALLSGQDSVIYTFTQTPNAPFKGESIVADLKQVISDFQPTKIFTSHPGDVHPDHQTLPLFLQVALWELEDQLAPQVYYFITHYGRWPQPRGYQPEQPLEPPSQYDVGNRWYILPISTGERENKLQALQAHKTQWGSGQLYLESVVRANELFDVLEEIPIAPGEEVEILPAETAFTGEALMLHPEDQQAAFTEAEVHTVKLEDDQLVFAVELEEPLAGDVHAKVWAMGYRADTPFGDMPKLFMDLSAAGYQVYDRGQELPADSITITGTPTRSEVRVPLALLGDPQRLLVSAQTNLGDVPLDNIPWVFLSIK